MRKNYSWSSMHYINGRWTWLVPPFMYILIIRHCWISIPSKIYHTCRHIGWRSWLFMIVNLYTSRENLTPWLTPSLASPFNTQTLMHKQTSLQYILTCPLNLPIPPYWMYHSPLPFPASPHLSTPLQTPPQLTTHSVKIDEDWINKLQEAYTTDPWCTKLLSASCGMPNLVIKNSLWFVKDCLLVPSNCRVWEHIFCIAHNSLGHFGFFKMYESIKSSYFWPNMHKDLEDGYVPSCMECQHNM